MSALSQFVSDLQDPSQPADPSADQPNQSVDPNAGQPNQAVDPNADGTATIPEGTVVGDPNASQPDPSADLNAGGTVTVPEDTVVGDPKAAGDSDDQADPNQNQSVDPNANEPNQTPDPRVSHTNPDGTITIPEVTVVGIA